MDSKNKIHITAILFCISGLLAGGCSNWLDVEPIDKNLEKTQFSTEENIYSVLNGLYVGMAASNLYGGRLTMTDIEQMAHYYYVPATIPANDVSKYTVFAGLQGYDYANTTIEARYSGIWSSAYTLILRCNEFIDNVEQSDILSQSNKNIVLGEAYAIRAFLHFDLFRLFGPVSPGSYAGTTIPYNRESGMQVQSYITADEFYENLLDDMSKATELLTNDPILEYGIVKFEDIDELSTAQKFNVCLRNRRLNLLATEALQARILLYWGDKAGAAAKAQTILNTINEKAILKWTDIIVSGSSTGLHVTVNSDYIFSSELLFSIENPELYSRWSTYTEGSQLHSTYAIHSVNLVKNIFASTEDNLTNATDLRARQWVSNEDLGSGYLVSRKYRSLAIEDDTYTNLIKYVQPLMRMSELYYMIAENLIYQNDLPGAMNIFNTVSAARNKKQDEELSGATREELITFLEKEYYREFYGEGQAFFFMKRNERLQMLNSSGSQGYVTMTLTNYVVPLPLDEVNN